MANEKEVNHNSCIKVEIVTPESSLLFENVHMAVMPGTQGEFGVLYGHVPLISTLDNGKLLIYNKDMKITDNVVIGPGFAEVTHESVLILTSNFYREN